MAAVQAGLAARRPRSPRRRTAVAVVALVASVAAPFLGIDPAWAPTALNVAFTFPAAAVVGASGTETFTIENASTAPESTAPVTLNTATLTVCSTQAFPCTPETSPVLAITPVPGSGAGACAGVNITSTQSGGVTTFNFPLGTQLAPPDGVPNSGPDFCSFQFTYVVQRAPAFDVAPGVPGLQTGLQGFAQATSNLTGNPGGGFSQGTLTVNPAQPSIVTQVVTANPPTPVAGSVPVGTTFSDTATVTGVPNGPAPTGTVTFTVFFDPPGAAPCSGAASPLAPATLTPGPLAPPAAPTSTATSPPVNATTQNGPGTYRFVASYSGDASYVALANTPCGAPGENVTVTRLRATLTTQASTNAPGVPPGTTVTDTATLTPPPGGPPPTGTITYTLVGPNPGATCTGPVVGAPSTVPVGSPSGTFTVTAPGTYNFVATYSGDTTYEPVATPVGCGVPAEMFTVAPVQASLTTQASTNSPNAVPGTAVTDTATLTPAPGGPLPTGTVTYTLVGPNPDAACTGPVFGNPSTAAVGSPSAAFAPTAPGTYNFLATYSGDANYAPITTPVGCGDPKERFTVTRANVSITTQASPPAPVGGTISDTATLSGGVNPTGTITFTLFGPDNTTCSGPPIFTSTVAVNGNGVYPSGGYVVQAAGSYRWIAEYSGDARNAPAGPTACADPLELTVGQRVTPQLRTEASAGVAGGSVFDTAFLTGGFNPTGTITFQLFGPDDRNCVRPPIFVSTKPVNGNGSVTSDSFILPAGGVYSFVASYSGDSNNTPVGPTACDDPAETIGAGRSPVSLTTQASPTVSAGNVIFDTATLTGFNPTGTITFNLYGPNNTTCTGTPAFVSVRPVNGSGTYQSTSFTPNAPGTYRWVAVYSGDANNVSVTTACDDPLEQVVVTPRPTIDIDKTAMPESRPVPGGTFIFTLVVTNTSNVPLTITSLTDDVYGDVTRIPGTTCDRAIGTRLAPSPGPGHTYTCRFPGEFRGPGGASQTDVVTVTGVDDRGNNVTDRDDAVVRITAVPPTITTTKTATPPTLPEPGGTFTFNFQVVNTGPEPVTIVSLTDDVYGDLDGRGTCAVGARLPANGGSYSCTFTGSFFANAGAAQTDTITTTGRDDSGQTVVSRSMATVRITDVPPSITVTKTPDPTSRPEPGGTFRFTVVVTNTSFEPVRITSLVDDIYGDLNRRGTCNVGATLAPNGGSYTCAFDGEFRGKAGDAQTDTVIVTAVDDEGTTVTARAKATVTITGVPPVAPPPPPPPPSPPPPARPPLVRTGSDSSGPVRTATLMVAAGVLMVLGARRSGPGGLGLAFSGPGGGGRGNDGPGRRRRRRSGGDDGPPDGASQFRGLPPGSPVGPAGGVGAGGAGAALALPVEDLDWDDLDRRTQWRRPPVGLIPAPPAAGVPAEIEVELLLDRVAPVEPADAEVLVPTVMATPPRTGLDAAALDAAAALLVPGRPGPENDSRRGRGRRLGRR